MQNGTAASDIAHLAPGGCAFVTAARLVIATGADAARDAVRSANLPIPIAAAASSLCSLIIYVVRP